MTIEDFSYSQSGGDVGSYNYSITFKEYRAIRVRQININNKKANVSKNQTSRVNTQKKPKTYTAKSGDTLYKIEKNIMVTALTNRKYTMQIKRLSGQTQMTSRVKH